MKLAEAIQDALPLEQSLAALEQLYVKLVDLSSYYPPSSLLISALTCV